ncbi:MAG: GntR family transcriptional regulator [Flavobacteriaceae bacterium]
MSLAAARTDGAEDRGHSQTVKALVGLRELILEGALEPGERIAELAMVDRLGVSRTPLRSAMVRLEGEGLLEAIPSGGYTVRRFSEQDILAAIEVRGAMEGLAARFAAERGLNAQALAPIKATVHAIDELIAADMPDSEAFPAYLPLNARFHEQLRGLAGSNAIEQAIDRANAHPFAAANGVILLQMQAPRARSIMIVGQDHHQSIVEAIENREAGRAEALAREHARLAHRNLHKALMSRRGLENVRGASLLIGRDGRRRGVS